MKRITLVAAIALAVVLGSGSAPAVVGGSVADPGEYPWMAAVYRGTSPAGGQFCGGTLVAPDVVVTAAHCVLDLLENTVALLPLDVRGQKLKVFLGETKLSAEGGERIVVSRVTSHASVDIAVLELTQPSAQTPLPWAGPADGSVYPPGTVATVTGWGATTEGSSRSNDLREAQVPIISDADCAASYPGQTSASLEVCAGYPEGGVDTCQGDSGGPMIVPKPGGFLLVGATSWGEGCARPGKPGVYAEIAAASDFIASFVG